MYLTRRCLYILHRILLVIKPIYAFSFTPLTASLYVTTDLNNLAQRLNVNKKHVCSPSEFKDAQVVTSSVNVTGTNTATLGFKGNYLSNSTYQCQIEIRYCLALKGAIL